ncbi:DNA ligase 1 [Orchesella cincta]|uniref:DNA ligase 1 n=1 Tax=Orchesella cincta TaxID=48709 RepID=A0A1D2NJ76_ORCCI|nr:DNA ligase 1 [Orchesella cincta]
MVRVELGVAETNVMKAIAQATGRSLDKIKSDATAAGDLGIVAESSRSTQKTLFQPPPLTVQAVFNKLKEVAGMTGSSSHSKKISMITSLLVACKYSEARYLARSLLGKLRIGLAEQSLLQAIAQACFHTPPEQDRSEWPPKKLDCGKKYSPEALKAKYEEEAYKDADEAEIKVQVCIFAFDLIYLNGESLIKKPLIERRELLREHFQAVTGEFVFATSLDTDSMEEVQEFLEESVKGNCEGLMVKTLDEKASYELAKRSQKWLKLKKDYMDSGGDSLDLVVIGGFNGKGKRTGTYGGFLLACYDPDEEAYQTICKLGTGFSDDDLQKHTESLKPHIIPNPKSYYRFNTQLTPDHWFDAVQVWEVKCADLSLSPVHTAAEGMADPQRGISLRFPRFIRLRDDKKIEDATTASQVADMYKSQEVVKNSTDKKKGVDDDDDFY